MRAPLQFPRDMDLRVHGSDPKVGLAQRRKAERPVAADATRIFASFGLLGRTRKLLHRVVTVTHSRGEFLAEPFRRLPKVVPALSRCLGKRRIGEMRPVAHSGAIFLELDLPLEIGRHLVEFTNDSLEILDLPGFFFHLATFQAYGGLT